MLLSAVLTTLLAAPAGESLKPFEFKDGDRIVWIGDTLVEREQRYSYWETALITANANKNITLRNLGWSGDTVFGEARGRFDFNNPAICFKQLVDQTLALKPTVIFVSYGANESFEGKEGLPKFEKGLEKLLDALKPANARIVLFTPAPVNAVEAGPVPGNPTPAERNASLALYGAAIQKIAKNRNHYCADLNKTIGVVFHTQKLSVEENPKLRTSKPAITTNGVHLSQAGYDDTTSAFLVSLGLGAKSLSEEHEKAESLRKAIVEKNQLFFHRWRPENETYLFGFRKHEQGKNAKEVAEFDPLVAKAEEEIAEIRKKMK